MHEKQLKTHGELAILFTGTQAYVCIALCGVGGHLFRHFILTNICSDYMQYVQCTQLYMQQDYSYIKKMKCFHAIMIYSYILNTGTLLEQLIITLFTQLKYFSVTANQQSAPTISQPAVFLCNNNSAPAPFEEREPKTYFPLKKLCANSIQYYRVRNSQIM